MGGVNMNPKFKVWIKMLMSFPFLMMDDIEDCWEEMKET